MAVSRTRSHPARANRLICHQLRLYQRAFFIFLGFSSLLPDKNFAGDWASHGTEESGGLTGRLGVLYADEYSSFMSVPVTLLVIDDDPQSLELVSATLEQDGLELLTADDPEEGLRLVRQRRPPIVLCDLMMPKMSGMQVLEEIVRFDPTIDVVLLTAHYSTESAVEAVQKGACDYFNKPISVARLRERVGQLISEARRRQQVQKLDRELLEANRFAGIIGRSPLMLEAFARIQRVAPHFRTVLVQGPTGSGKELVARALHDLSPVAKGPFVVCNCAAIAETLVESELFGYVRGAFTGATQDKVGLFEHANNGTLLLDEIGEMPLGAQAKLLRAVQQQEVQRVGSPAARKVNVRIVAATHRDLRSLVAEGRFREDLYFRLAMVEIRLPSLSDRREDLPLLQRHFVEYFAEQYGKPLEGLTRRAESLLSRHSWPGNVRELEGIIGYAAMMAEGSMIDVQDLPNGLREMNSARGEAVSDLNLSLEQMERRHARRVLESVGGNKVQAAQILGISRATLYRLLAEAEV